MGLILRVFAQSDGLATCCADEWRYCQVADVAGRLTLFISWYSSTKFHPVTKSTENIITSSSFKLHSLKVNSSLIIIPLFNAIIFQL